MAATLLRWSRSIASMSQHHQPSRHRFPPPTTVNRIALPQPASDTSSSQPASDIRLTDNIKQQFSLSVPLLAASVPSPLITKFKAHPEIKKALLNSKNLRSVEPDPDSPDNAFKLLLLNASQKDQIPLSTLNVFQENDIKIKDTELKLNWDYWMADEIIERLLPDQLTDIPASFTIIGHIAHFNLRDEYLPYKHLIGQVILEKNLAIKTVVNKVDNINSQFRFFEMELLAGEPNYTVTLWQSGCRYRFDFSKVYYNPRLSTEHDLLSSQIQKDEIVVDAFAGVGPFVMRAAANRNAWVLASDLNPASVEALATNVKLNKLHGRVAVSVGDGREKIRQAVRTLWLDKPFNIPNAPPLLPDHFIINLPDSSIQFLDAFRDLYLPLSNSEGFLDAVKKKSRLPLLHCYCFTREVDNPEDDICLRVSEVMKVKISPSTVARFELKFVRAVAPRKDMYRITFELPLELLLPSYSSST